MSADLTLPSELVTGIRIAVETTYQALVAVARPVSVSAGKAGPPEEIASDIPMRIFVPQHEPQITLLADLGGGRARLLGFAPFGTDVQAGDVLTDQDTATYMVVATASAPPSDMVICALSKQRPT